MKAETKTFLLLKYGSLSNFFKHCMSIPTKDFNKMPADEYAVFKIYVKGRLAQLDIKEDI